MLLFMDLRADADWVLREEALNAGLHYAGLKSGMDAFVRLFEHYDRRATGGARRVHLTPELRAHPLFSRYESVISEIREVLQRGGDLTPYLSKGIKRQGEAGRDLMQLHWGIRHLHLSTLASAQNGFVARADHLLFFITTDNAAYLLDIAPHGEPGVFEQERLLALVHQHWPGLLMSPKGVLRTEREVRTATERRQLRKAHVNYFETVNGRVVMPTSGVTMAGSPMQASMDYMHLMRGIDALEERLQEMPLRYFPALAGRGVATIRLTAIWSHGVYLRADDDREVCQVRLLK